MPYRQGVITGLAIGAGYTYGGCYPLGYWGPYHEDIMDITTITAGTDL